MTSAPTDTVSNAGPRVLLLPSYDHDDIGGRAVLAGLCESLQCADPGARITVVSSSGQAGDLPGVVRIIPRGARGLAQLLVAARHQDVVVVDDGGRRRGDDGGIAARVHAARLKLVGLFNDNVRVQTLGADAAPDPAFALSPAAPGDAFRVLCGLGIDPHRPLIGVVMRGLDERGAGSPWGRLRQSGLFASVSRDIELARVLDEVALAVQTLARRMGAAVLLLPTSNRGTESDNGYCYQLAAMLRLDCVRVAHLHDPRLYKAVCGHLELMISARVHSLLLAAGMGVPGVALAAGGGFDRHFDLLDIPRRVVPLEDFRDGAQADRLVALGEEAVNARGDLRERCDRLRGCVVRNAAALLEPPANCEVLRPVASRPQAEPPAVSAPLL